MNGLIDYYVLVIERVPNNLLNKAKTGRFTGGSNGLEISTAVGHALWWQFNIYCGKSY